MTPTEFLSSEICPQCGVEENNVVTNSRIYQAGRHRRRMCRSCGHRWSTIEVSVKLIAALREAIRSSGDYDTRLMSDLHKISVLVADIRGRIDRSGDVLNLPHIVGEDE